MTDDPTIFEGIERGERWVAQRWDRSEAIDTEAIKHRVRIEIGQQWLARKLRAADAAPVDARIRGTVRAAIADVRRGAGGRASTSVRRLFRWAAIGVGAAALWGLTFSTLFRPSSTTPVAEEWEAFYVGAFEQYDDDEWDASLDELSKDLESLSSRSGSLAEDDEGRDVWFSLENGDESTAG